MTQSPLTVPALLHHSVAEFGESAYLVTPSERLTYLEAEQRSGRLARWLLRRGGGQGQSRRPVLPQRCRVGDLVARGVADRCGRRAVEHALHTRRDRKGVAPGRHRAAHRARHRAEHRCGSTVGSGPARADRPAHEPAGPARRPLSASHRADRRGGPGLGRHAGYDESGRRGAGRSAGRSRSRGLPRRPRHHGPHIGVHRRSQGVLHTHGTLVRQTSTWPGAIRAITGTEDRVRGSCARCRSSGSADCSRSPAPCTNR